MLAPEMAVSLTRRANALIPAGLMVRNYLRGNIAAQLRFMGPFSVRT